MTKSELLNKISDIYNELNDLEDSFERELKDLLENFKSDIKRIRTKLEELPDDESEIE